MSGSSTTSQIKRRPPASKRLICTPDHRYFYGGAEVPGNTAVLRASGYGHDYGTSDDLERGRHVHLACRFLTEGRLNWAQLAPSRLPYVQGWAGFLSVSGFDAKAGWLERMIYCRRYGFATRPDAVGWLNRRLVVLQIKTGGLDPAVGPQTAGEALAVEDALGVRPERFAVVLPGNGRFSLMHLTSRADKPAFLAALTSWNARRRAGWNGKQVER